MSRKLINKRSSRNVEKIVTAIWLTRTSPYEITNSKRKQLSLPMVRYRSFENIDKIYKRNKEALIKQMLRTNDFEEIKDELESLQNTICFIDGFGSVVDGQLEKLNLKYCELPAKEKIQINEIITECLCGVIKLTDSPCENCGG